MRFPVSWSAVFGNDRPVEIEIGPGRGEALLAAAAIRPATNFLGIEHNLRAAERIVAQVTARGLENVRVVPGDARCIIARLVADASVTTYHIYFPDPWPKNRHHRRRLATPEFARHVARTLVPAGRVHVLTDLPALLADFIVPLEQAGLVHHRDAAPPGGRPVTRYERKYGGGGVYYAGFARGARGSGTPAPGAADCGTST